MAIKRVPRTTAKGAANRTTERPATQAPAAGASRAGDPRRAEPVRATTIECAAGTLVVGRRAGALVADWKTGPDGVLPADASDREALALAEALRRALVAGDETALARFDEGPGTPFQRRVWRVCRTIPRGETRTYGELAAALGLARGGARAVGQALRRNPLPVLVPCHRVVSASGMGGYAGTTAGALAKVKQTLLEVEREV